MRRANAAARREAWRTVRSIFFRPQLSGVSSSVSRGARASGVSLVLRADEHRN